MRLWGLPDGARTAAELAGVLLQATEPPPVSPPAQPNPPPMPPSSPSLLPPPPSPLPMVTVRPLLALLLDLLVHADAHVRAAALPPARALASRLPRGADGFAAASCLAAAAAAGLDDVHRGAADGCAALLVEVSDAALATACAHAEGGVASSAARAACRRTCACDDAGDGALCDSGGGEVRNVGAERAAFGGSNAASCDAAGAGGVGVLRGCVGPGGLPSWHASLALATAPPCAIRPEQLRALFELLAPDAAAGAGGAPSALLLRRRGDEHADGAHTSSGGGGNGGGEDVLANFDARMDRLSASLLQTPATSADGGGDGGGGGSKVPIPQKAVAALPTHVRGAMEWRIVHHAARTCVLSRMRTHAGGPAQSFALLEGMLASAAARIQQAAAALDPSARGAASGDRCAAGVPPSPQRQPPAPPGVALPARDGVHACVRSEAHAHAQHCGWLLLELIGALERWLHAASDGVPGCASLPLPRPVLAFFSANRRAVDEWLARVRPRLLLLARLAGCEWHAVRYGMQHLEDERQRLKAAMAAGAAAAAPTAPAGGGAGAEGGGKPARRMADGERGRGVGSSAAAGVPAPAARHGTFQHASPVGPPSAPTGAAAPRARGRAASPCAGDGVSGVCGVSGAAAHDVSGVPGKRRAGLAVNGGAFLSPPVSGGPLLSPPDSAGAPTSVGGGAASGCGVGVDTASLVHTAAVVVRVCMHVSESMLLLRDADGVAGLQAWASRAFAPALAA
eukprot:358334-Chlamydomonas_euryale.AAC.1